MVVQEILPVVSLAQCQYQNALSHTRRMVLGLVIVTEETDRQTDKDTERQRVRERRHRDI